MQTADRASETRGRVARTNYTRKGQPVIMSIGRGNEAAEDEFNTRTTRMNDDENGDSNPPASEETQANDSNTPAWHWRKGAVAKQSWSAPKSQKHRRIARACTRKDGGNA